MKLKQWILPILLVVVVGGYFAYRQFFNAPAPTTTPNNNPTLTGNETTNPTPTTQSGYKDGQYTGQVANTIYGDVQVMTIISGGKIVNIKMLKAPDKPGYTTELTNSSFPLMITEAILVQSAKVNTVTGATQNTEGFSQSLETALSMAS